MEHGGSEATGAGAGQQADQTSPALSPRISWRVVDESCKSFFLSFVGVLALSSAVSISLACVIIIFLWFRTAQTTVAQLSDDYRGTVLSTVKGNIQRQLTEPLIVMEHLEAWASLRFGDFSGVAEIDKERGFLAGVSLERQLYPALSTIGIGVGSGLQFGVQNQARSIPQVNATGGNVYFLHDALLDANGSLPANSTLFYFQLSTLNPSSADFLQPDFRDSDDAAAIVSRLGPPVGNLSNVDARTRTYFPRGVAVARLGRATLGWNAPIDSAVNSNDLAVSAVKPSQARKANGDPFFVCFASILMTQLDDILRSYNIGQHGRAFVFTGAGRLIAASVQLNPRQRANTNLFQKNQFSLDVPAQLLIERGFAVEDALEPSLGGVITRVPDVDLYDSFGGVRYNMRASQLVIPALDWFVVVYTLDTDFDGGLNEAVRTTSILSAVVVVSAVLLTVLLARLLTSPLLRVSSLMQDAVVAIGMDKGRRQRRALRKLNREFERQTGMKVNEADPDAEPVDVPAVTPMDPSPELNGSPSAPVAAAAGTTPSSPLRESSFLRSGPSAPPSQAALVKRTIASDQGVEMHAMVPASGASPIDIEAQLEPAKVMRNGALRSAAAPPQPWWRRWFCCCVRPAPPPVSSNSSGSSRRPSQSPAPRPRRSSCLRSPGSCLSEVKLMHASIGSMLHALSSYDQLEHINNAKRSFIRYIFHEVRVPFNAVVLATEQLQMYADPLVGEHASDIRDLVTLVSEQATVVARILNDVLSMQKIEDGGLTLSPEAFDLPAMVRVTLSSFKELMLAKQITLVTDLPSLDSTSFARAAGLAEGGQRLLVWGDRYRLRQVLGNFISNGIAYSPAGGTITVRLQFDEKSFKPADANGALAQEIASNERACSSSASPPKGALDIHASQPLPSTAFAQKGTGSSMRSTASAGRPASNGASSSPVAPRTTVYATASSALPPAKGFGRGAGLGMQSTMSSEESSSGLAASSDQWPQESPDGTAAAPQGSHSHTPTFGHTLFGSCSIRLSVSDCGPGIPVEHQSKIFSAYKQVQSARIQQGRGTGLGLQISKSIVELHGGRIGFSTQPGLGTDFFFSLALPLLLSGEGESNEPNHSLTSALLDVIEDEDDAAMHQHAARERDAENQAETRALSNPRLLHESDDGDSDVASVHFVDDEADPEPAAAAAASAVAGIGSALASAAAASSPVASPKSCVYVGSALAPPSAVVSSTPMGDFPSASGTPTAAGSPCTPSTTAQDTAHTQLRTVAAAAVPSAMAASSSSSSAGRVLAPVVPKPRVLVVEDSTPNRKLLCNLLKILQCDVVGAEHGQAAVDLFADCIAHPESRPVPFDIVLMDGSMPVMSGLEATVYLRSHGVTLPILAVTGNALQEDVSAFVAAGAQFVLTKPINRAMLVHALHKHLPRALAVQIPAGK